MLREFVIGLTLAGHADQYTRGHSVKWRGNDPLFQGVRKSTAARGRAALTWNGAGAVLARVTGREEPRPRLATALQSAPPGRAPDLAGLASGANGLSRGPLSTVLAEDRYQLLLEELPNAPRDEMRSALGFRIRDRIETPLDEAVIELLEMPPQARATGTRSAYAIVTSQEDVQDHVARVRAAGLKLDTIDLPELCMRNLAVRLPQDQDGVAFLHFTDEHGLLTITRQGVLYLVRRIEVGRLQLDMTPTTQVNTGLIPSICLELQRSLDYYEAHYDLPSIGELVLGPGTAVAGLGEAIAGQLGLTVSTLDLAGLFELDEELDQEQQKACLFAAGAALRTDAATGWDG